MFARSGRRLGLERSPTRKVLTANENRAVVGFVNPLDNYIPPRWKEARLADLRTSWWMTAQLRGVMSGIITKATEWEVLLETFANPTQRVKPPKKTWTREKRIPAARRHGAGARQDRLHYNERKRGSVCQHFRQERKLFWIHQITSAPTNTCCWLAGRRSGNI
jgi:hypothetical protein